MRITRTALAPRQGLPAKCAAGSAARPGPAAPLQPELRRGKGEGAGATPRQTPRGSSGNTTLCQGYVRSIKVS